MAKQNKLSKRKQKEYLRKQGYSYKEINKIDQKTKDKLTDIIISNEAPKKKRKNNIKTVEKEPKKQTKSRYLTFKNRVTKKRFYLDSIGIEGALERGKFSDKQIDSVRLSDIENGTVTREKYPWLFINSSFDFNKIYKFKNNNRMFVAFRDYQGEMDISDALRDFSKYNDGALVDFLENIVNMPATYQKGVSGSSSGRAGGYRFMVAPQMVIDTFNRDTYNESRKDKRALKNQGTAKQKRKKKRQHYKGDKVGFQVIKDGNRVSFDKVTPRNLLIMANAIMYNVTEKDRADFYTRFYEDITSNIPDMIEILPKP